jgi:hypothetical protein
MRCRLRPASSFSAIAVRYRAAVNRGRGAEPGNVLAGFASEPANVLAAFGPSTAGRSGDSAGGDASEPGNVLAAFAERRRS